MDSPNVKMRRHQSLPAAARRNSILLRISKSNPYVGTFRHSPPTAAAMAALHAEDWKAAGRERSKKLWTMTTGLCKSSPYVGTHRHAPPSWSLAFSSLRLLAPSTLLEVELCRLLLERTFLPAKLGVDGLHRLQDLLCGHLLGGGTNERLIDWQIGLVDRHHAPSGTVQVLTRLACWLLLPFQDSPLLRSSSSSPLSPSTSCRSECCEEGSSIRTSDYETDENAISEYDDDCSYIGGGSAENDVGPSHSSVVGSHSVVSSQAEAYYAHQATTAAASKVGTATEPFDDTITQMDVLRMMRNASRHLDVASIARLPVHVYRRDAPSSPPSFATCVPPDSVPTRADEDSWCLVVPQEEDADEGGGHVGVVAPSSDPSFGGDGDERDVCVICLEHFEDGDRLRVLPCDHSFHDGCISRWLSGSHSFDDCFTTGCPTCRKPPAPPVTEPVPLDGSVVPSWAFARIGDALARNY